MIHYGRDGLNGQQGVSGDNGNDGIGGTGCQTQDTVEGVMLLCGNDTQAYLRDGADGQPGTDGLPGSSGNPGTGCTTSTVSNGQSIACANDTLTLKDNPGCTFSSTETGTTVACADLEGAITSTETIAHYAYVEPFGLGATNTQNNGNANTTYFSLVEVPVSGTYDQFVLFQGDEPNDGNYPTLEVGIFEKVEENWQLVSGSSVVTIPAPGPGVDSDLATHSFDYGYYRRSGLNASLISQTPYLFLVRISGTTWRFSAHTASASTAPFHTWTKSVNQNLENYTTTLSDSDGTRVSPWFRLSQ